MVYALQIAVRNIRNRAVQSLLTLIVVALAVALTITILVLADGLQQGILTASRGFGVLLIGPKGSPQQLALSTILLQGVPIGLMDQSAYQDILAKNPAIKIAPLAMSDNIGGASIIGTDQSFFLLQRDNNDPLFQIAAGRLFAGDFEVVLGSQTATESALKIGDRFHPSHGIGKGLTSDVHTNITYTVVGILKPSHSPYDRAAFATINSIWVTHDTANETSDPNAQTSDASDAGKVAPSHGLARKADCRIIAALRHSAQHHLHHRARAEQWQRCNGGVPRCGTRQPVRSAQSGASRAEHCGAAGLVHGEHYHAVIAVRHYVIARASDRGHAQFGCQSQHGFHDHPA